MPVRQEPVLKLGEEPDGPFAYRLVAGSTRILEGQTWDVERPAGMTGYILNLTVDGIGRVGKAQRVEAGSLLLFSPKAVHDYGRAPEARRWHHRWIYFLPRSSWQDWLHWPRFANDIGHMQLDRSLFPRIAALMQEVERVAAEGRPLAETLAMNLLEQILILLASERTQDSDDERDPRIIAACAFIAEQHARDLGVADVAAEVGLSASRLAHLFRQQVGVGVVQWRDQQRIQRASQLLKATGLPVRDIAERVGYDDPLYFARVFRRHLDCSPSVYRAESE